jgi:hypothetical protein
MAGPACLPPLRTPHRRLLQSKHTALSRPQSLRHWPPSLLASAKASPRRRRRQPDHFSSPDPNRHRAHRAQP